MPSKLSSNLNCKHKQQTPKSYFGFGKLILQPVIMAASLPETNLVELCIFDSLFVLWVCCNLYVLVVINKRVCLVLLLLQRASSKINFVAPQMNKLPKCMQQLPTQM